ncbi:MAG: serine hydrolase, partial [Clostridia bacterium]|nr:serine hydrolase [Clostridia bacterium]
MNFDSLTALLDSFPGIGSPGVDCAVYVDHEPIYRHMAGFSDREANIPMQGDETYFIYSCSKPIT